MSGVPCSSASWAEGRPPRVSAPSSIRAVSGRSSSTLLVSGSQCTTCFLRSPGSPRGRPRRLPHGLSSERFFRSIGHFSMTTPRYEPHEIEAKWQRVWEDAGAFHVENPVEGEPAADNHWYQLEMLPYPSAPSIHMGHVLNYTMGDVQTHVRRRSGWHVVRPMGWDAFGLPAENAAIREGRHPRETIERNIETMRAQMKRLGWAIDWDREVSAHQPTFYRWTQWLFQQFVARDLCYRREGPVNWCPNDQTVIANE